MSEVWVVLAGYFDDGPEVIGVTERASEGFAAAEADAGGRLVWSTDPYFGGEGLRGESPGSLGREYWVQRWSVQGRRS